MIDTLAGHMEGLRPQIQSARKALESQITPAVLLGLKLCVALVILFFLSVLAGAVTAKRDQISELKQELVLQKQTLEGIDWSVRNDEASRLFSQVEQRLWPGATSGLAQADFEKWLRDTLESSGLTVTQIRTRAVPVSTMENVDERTAAKIERITSKILMEFDERGFGRALNAIANKESIVIVRMVNARAGPTMRVEMDIDTFRFKDSRS